MLELREVRQGYHEVVVAKSKKVIGVCSMEIDGYYLFYSNENGGWNEYALREVARLLGGLNLEWDEHLSKVFL